MPREKRIDEIKRICSENDLPVAEVFREAKIPYSTVANWDRKEPDAFQTYDTIMDTIEVMKKAKEQPAQ